MSDTIAYQYPKSSCNCYNCTKKDYPCESGNPSNMSVRDCKVPSAFECYDKIPFRNDIEPQDKKGYKVLNSLASAQNMSKDFQRFECSGQQGCPKVQYASKDPRLISVPHGGQVMTLDRPPYDSSVKLSQVATDKHLDAYGQNYSGYSDINAGHYTYYINRSREDPFYPPNFTISANAIGTLYQDPMGAIRPQYTRKPLKCNNPLNTKKDHYDGGLSWIQDSTEHREDLLSYQMRKRNEQRYEPRWEGLRSNSTCYPSTQIGK